MKIIFLIILIFASQINFAQDEEIFDRLRAIQNNGITFYNIDGINFSKQTFYSDFNEKNLKKVYRKYKIKKKDKKKVMKTLNFDNYKVINKEKNDSDLISVSVNYFVKNNENRISVFWFGYYDNDNPEFEIKMIELILNNKIPKSCFDTINIDNINFAGRKIRLNSNCKWMNINNIQCPYNGQMNWSVHKTKGSADLAIENQLKTTKARKNGKIISEEEVDMIFEGVKTKAKKIYYDFTGITSALASVSGGKSLTIYYVSEKIRSNYVSCVLSFWNNDNINSSGLTPLLEEVMSLTKKQ